MNVTLQGRIDASHSPCLLLIVKLCLLVQRLSYFIILSVANFCGVARACVCVCACACACACVTKPTQQR